jgi:hypothetical protein
MGILTEGRLTPSTFYLLEQLAEPDALLVFASTRDEGDPRFYYEKGLAHRLVPERTVDALIAKGYLLRTASPVPIYRITDKGRAYLRVAGNLGVGF